MFSYNGSGFLKLSETTELDVLNNCMETMVERYHQEILPVAIQLTARLVRDFLNSQILSTCGTHPCLTNDSVKRTCAFYEKLLHRTI